MQRLLPPTLVLLLALAAAIASWLIPVAAFPPSPWRWAGVPLTIAGLAVSTLGSRRFASVGTNIKTFDDPDILVDDGLFAVSRNPMYLGFVVALVGWALAWGALTAWLAPALFLLAADRWYIPFEEARMMEQFGRDYERYRRETSRWVGRR